MVLHIVHSLNLILYQKHLARGVKKGAMTEDQASAKLQAWVEEKEGRLSKRREAAAVQKRQAIAAIDGKPKVKAKPVVEEPAAPAEEPNAE